MRQAPYRKPSRPRRRARAKAARHQGSRPPECRHKPRCTCCGAVAHAGLVVLGAVLAVPGAWLDASACAACVQIGILSRSGRERLLRAMLRGAPA